MRKLWFLLIMVGAVLLSACGQVATPAAQSTAAVPTDNPKAIKMECKVVGSIEPTPDATLVARFPESQPGDWTEGSSSTAALRIIEYSDYM